MPCLVKVELRFNRDLLHRLRAALQGLVAPYRVAQIHEFKDRQRGRGRVRVALGEDIHEHAPRLPLRDPEVVPELRRKAWMEHSKVKESAAKLSVPRSELV